MNHGALKTGVCLLLAVIAALAIAACGSSGTGSAAASGAGAGTTTSGSAPANRFAALASCLKQHGVTLPNFGHRPGTTTTGGSGAPPAGGFGGGSYGGGPGAAAGGPAGGGFLQRNPKLAAAMEACRKKLGITGGFGGGFRRPGFSQAALTKFEGCMKQHGVPLSKSTSGRGVFSSSARKNPKFPAALKACASILRAPAPAGTSTAANA
jgi:hypothetical protein